MKLCPSQAITSEDSHLKAPPTFLINFSFGIIPELQKGFKDSTESSHRLFSQNQEFNIGFFPVKWSADFFWISSGFPLMSFLFQELTLSKAVICQFFSFSCLLTIWTALVVDCEVCCKTSLSLGFSCGICLLFLMFIFNQSVWFFHYIVTILYCYREKVDRKTQFRLVLFWPHMWHVEVPESGIEPLQWQAGSLTCCTTKQLLRSVFLRGLEMVSEAISRTGDSADVSWKGGIVWIRMQTFPK